MCNCARCIENERISAILLRGDVDELKTLVLHLRDMADHAEMDNDVYRAIFDGKWPSARQQLQEGLERAIAYETEQATVGR
jgi:hypothetical protein